MLLSTRQSQQNNFHAQEINCFWLIFDQKLAKFQGIFQLKYKRGEECTIIYSCMYTEINLHS